MLSSYAQRSSRDKTSYLGFIKKLEAEIDVGIDMAFRA